MLQVGEEQIWYLYCQEKTWAHLDGFSGLALGSGFFWSTSYQLKGAAWGKQYYCYLACCNVHLHICYWSSQKPQVPCTRGSCGWSRLVWRMLLKGMEFVSNSHCFVCHWVFLSLQVQVFSTTQDRSHVRIWFQSIARWKIKLALAA